MHSKSDIILHIGLAKAGSTTFQQIIFPKLSKYLGYEYNHKHSELSTAITEHILRMRTKDNIKPFSFQENTIISNEDLGSWNPFYWEQFSRYNLEAFHKSTKIFLIIRKPSSWLRSNYVHHCIAQLNVKKPSDFFVENSVYHENLNLFYEHKFKDPIFAIEKFNYEKLIDFYIDKFNFVVVVKVEKLGDFGFLDDLFQRHITIKDELAEEYKSNISNEGLNKFQTKATIAFESFLNKFDLSLKRSRLDVEGIKFPKGIHYIINLMSCRLSWRILIRNKFINLFKHDQFDLDFSELPFIDVNKLDEEYDKLLDKMVFSRD